MALRGIVFLVLLLIPLSAQPAFAVLLFQDDFSLDPASNGWTEEIKNGVPFDDISQLVHLDHGNEVFFKINSDKIGAPVRLFSINQTISTVGFENIQIRLSAHQLPGAYEPVDFLEISVDTNGDGIFESVLKDVERWDGVEDQHTPDLDNPATTSPLSTLFIPLPNAATNNPNLNIKIEASFNSRSTNPPLEGYFLTEVEVIGDAVPLDSDNDGDGLGDNEDNCPAIANADQADFDLDGLGDVCDNAPNDPNPGQEDADADGIGDVADNCPATPNAGQEDNDGDGIGNACETMDISIIILDAINQLLALLQDPIFGLEEIKTEVEIIETEVLDTDHGLVAIKTAVDNIETETDKIQMLKDDVEMLKSQLTNMEEKIDTLVDFLVPPTPEEKALEKANKAQIKADQAQQKADENPNDVKKQEKADEEQAKACEKIQKEITKLEDKGITVPVDLQDLFVEKCTTPPLP